MMKIKYKHTNIVARDWQALAEFYETVLGCVRVPPERHLSGDWLAQGTGVSNAEFSGIHLRLPGHGENGPTLEIYQYSKIEPGAETKANRQGITHLAFEVEDVTQVTKTVLEHGGQKLGEITTSKIEGVGWITFVYLADPEGNIIELQSWH